MPVTSVFSYSTVFSYSIIIFKVDKTMIRIPGANENKMGNVLSRNYVTLALTGARQSFT